MSIAAPEIRMPLTAITTSAQLGLRTAASATPDIQRIVQDLLGILGCTNRLVVLINDLMDVSRIRNGQLLQEGR